MILVDEEEIVKVSADLSCRLHHRIEIKLRPLRERRKDPRQHGGLDLRRQRQLGSDPLLLRRDLRQTRLVLLKLPLHGRHVEAQVLNFISRVNVKLRKMLRPRHVVLPIVHILYGSLRDPVDRLHQCSFDPLRLQPSEQQCHRDDRDGQLQRKLAHAHQHIFHGDIDKHEGCDLAGLVLHGKSDGTQQAVPVRPLDVVEFALAIPGQELFDPLPAHRLPVARVKTGIQIRIGVHDIDKPAVGLVVHSDVHVVHVIVAHGARQHVDQDVVLAALFIDIQFTIKLAVLIRAHLRALFRDQVVIDLHHLFGKSYRVCAVGGGHHRLMGRAVGDADVLLCEGIRVKCHSHELRDQSEQNTADHG